MSIRSTAKAIVVDRGRVLLNLCQDQWNGEYYTLPGGGQETYETIAQALVRECREETGYTVRPIRFAALYEEICDDPLMREQYPTYAHKMLHIFLCELASSERQEPTEVDDFQLSCQWVGDGAAGGDHGASCTPGGASKGDPGWRSAAVSGIRPPGPQSRINRKEEGPLRL